jgi:hypothetical protein
MADANFDQLIVNNNVGIGTTTPNAQLHIDADAGDAKVLVESGGNLFKLLVDGAGATIGTANATPFILKTDDTARLTINPIGNIGVGKEASPSFKFDVNGVVNATGFNRGGLPWKIQTGDLEDNAITAAKIADGAISLTKLAPTVLATKADLAGAESQNFAAKDLKVQGNCTIDGAVTLGNADTDQVNIHGVMRSTHSSATLQCGNPLKVVGKITAEANWTEEEGALTLIGDKPTIRFSGGAISGNQSWVLHLGSFGPGNLEFFQRTGAASWRSALAMAASGNIGVGTSAPRFGLDVRGWLGSGDSSHTTGGWRLGRWPDYTTANTWVYLSRADQSVYQDLAVGSLWAGGALRFGTADDVAEMTPTKEADQLEPGDVVIIDHPPDNRVLLAKSEKPYDRRVAGVISDPETAGLIIGGSHPHDRDRADIKPLALCGRVLTKVSLENGDIQPGDYLTTASTAGYAMKATEPGYVLGKAMQAFNRNNRLNDPAGKIWILVNLGWVGG